jgi:hypothetical protein
MGSPQPVKFDSEKVRLDLLPVLPLIAVARVFQLGAKKYGEYNYAEGDGFEASRLYAAALRHLFAWWMGENNDIESGESHLAHAVCCILMLMVKHVDDRPSFGGGGKDEA